MVSCLDNEKSLCAGSFLGNPLAGWGRKLTAQRDFLHSSYGYSGCLSLVAFTRYVSVMNIITYFVILCYLSFRPLAPVQWISEGRFVRLRLL